MAITVTSDPVEKYCVPMHCETLSSKHYDVFLLMQKLKLISRFLEIVRAEPLTDGFLEQTETGQDSALQPLKAASMKASVQLRSGRVSDLRAS